MIQNTQKNDDKAEFKELQGRYATKMLFPHRKYYFTKDKNCPFDALTTGRTGTYVEEYKVYNNPKYPRLHNKTWKGDDLIDYQIDYNKCREVCKRAKNDKEGDRIPLIIAYFTDKLFVWDLNKTDWEKTAEWVKGNAKGIGCKEKEVDLQAKLKLEDAIYDTDIPVGLWEAVNAEIEKDYPELYKRIVGYNDEE